MREDGGVTPLEPYPGSQNPWRCKCNTCGVIVAPRLAGVRAGQGACIHCGYAKGGASNRLPPEEANEMMFRRGNVTPLEPYKSMNTPWRCRCNSCGKVVTPRLASVRNGNGACRYCAAVNLAESRRVSPDVAISDLKRIGKATPLEPYPGSQKPWLCKCDMCGKEIKTKGLSELRRSGFPMCSTCGGFRYRGDLSRRPDEEARAFMIEHGAIPDTNAKYTNAHEPWLSRCATCGKRITPTFNNVKKGFHPCIYCAPAGFDLSKPSIVYVLHHPHWHAYKVGVAGQHTQRLQEHRFDGWKILATYEFETGSAAKATETEVFKNLVARGISRGFVGKDQMRRRGYTETFSTASIKREDLLNLVSALAQKHS